ncbi:MAG: HEPN domain-containing protein [Candidatus Omnitrophota bacterium]|nr:HEPN domain-containing protein [Candidatus Omnitrophota bacterium]
MKKYDLKEALEKKKIIPFSVGHNLSCKELEAAKEDILDAKDLFSRGRFKSATTLAYYTIFHTARALLYKKRYREKAISN